MYVIKLVSHDNLAQTYSKCFNNIVLTLVTCLQVITNTIDKRIKE